MDLPTTLEGGVAVILGILGILAVVGGAIIWIGRPLRRWFGQVYATGTALQDMIEHERHHFELIEAGKEYNSDSHKKSGDYAFVNLNKSLEACIPLLVFRGPCLHVKREVERIQAMRQTPRSKGNVVPISVGAALSSPSRAASTSWASTFPQDVAAFMPLLAKLESRLDRFLPLLKIVRGRK